MRAIVTTTTTTATTDAASATALASVSFLSIFRYPVTNVARCADTSSRSIDCQPASSASLSSRYQPRSDYRVSSLRSTFVSLYFQRLLPRLRDGEPRRRVSLADIRPRIARIDPSDERLERRMRRQVADEELRASYRRSAVEIGRLIDGSNAPSIRSISVAPRVSKRPRRARHAIPLRRQGVNGGFQDVLFGFPRRILAAFLDNRGNWSMVSSLL